MSGCRYPQVGVSIVAYRPQEELTRLLTALAGEVGAIFLVDNGGAAAWVGAANAGHVTVIDPGGNVGVATGHNLAVARVFAAGCSHALLFDQDSLPQGDMIGELLRVEAGLLADGYRVGAVGPQLISSEGGPPAGFLTLCGGRVRTCIEADADLPVPASYCDFLITSGTLVRREVFAHVGAFVEGLFIDNVDVEWCYRAAHLGYGCYGAVAAQMVHALGDDSVALPFARQRRLVIHNPLRIYYITRNRLLLYRMPHVPWGWKFADFPRMVLKIAAFALLVPQRRRYLRAALAGIGDGLRGLGGATGKPF